MKFDQQSTTNTFKYATENYNKVNFIENYIV